MSKRNQSQGQPVQAKRTDPKRSAEAKRSTIERRTARRIKYGMGA